jgi:putative tryptophan/tyrosine transport system substrate-binding protein
MKRRDFITILASATAWASGAYAQEPRHVIGFLSGFSDAMPGTLAPFYQGLKETGFVEGKNVSIEFRWADGHYDRLPSLATELVVSNVSVIFAYDLPSAFAAKAATKTIPIVFLSGSDPVKAGLVESFSRPNGNLTGVSIFFSVLGPKRVELLRELLPAVKTIALLGNPCHPNFQLDTPDIRAAADALTQRLEVLPASTEGELEAAFSTMVQHRIGALIVTPVQDFPVGDHLIS